MWSLSEGRRGGFRKIPKAAKPSTFSWAGSWDPPETPLRRPWNGPGTRVRVGPRRVQKEGSRQERVLEGSGGSSKVPEGPIVQGLFLGECRRLARGPRSKPRAHVLGFRVYRGWRFWAMGFQALGIRASRTLVLRGFIGLTEFISV